MTSKASSDLKTFVLNLDENFAGKRRPVCVCYTNIALRQVLKFMRTFYFDTIQIFESYA